MEGEEGIKGRCGVIGGGDGSGRQERKRGHRLWPYENDVGK
jgi:hypothetical protein